MSENQFNQLIKKISINLKEDKYFKYNISSIYFDTDDYDLIRKSLEKPIYKEKIRVRSYGKINEKDNVFFEIKKKYKGMTNKRRIIISYKDFLNYINDNKNFEQNQISKEIDYIIRYYKLHPKVYISYDRISYICKDNNNLRITFDTNLKYRLNDLSLKNNNAEVFDNKNFYIMEIKTLDSIPLWLVNVLSELKIYPTSFSKYGNIYKKYIKEVKIC